MSPTALSHRIGQLAFAGFSGPAIPPDLRALAREFDLGGVVLFARNVQGPEQVAELSFDARQLGRELPAWVAVDQEGGRVARLRRPFTEWPPMSTLGRSGSEALAGRFAHALAEELRAVGITMDFAPVLDVHSNAKNPVIGDRALAGDADVVASLGVAIIRALQQDGVAACGKHFPGHGDTGVDSHVELPVVEHGPDRLRAIELVPFRRAIAADVASIMVAHLLMSAFDEDRPATLSRSVVTGLLRDELGYRGAVLTDDLSMGGCAGRFSLEQAVVGALQAGCDGLLLCEPAVDRQAAALEAIIHAVEDESLPLARVEEATATLRRMKEKFLSAEAASWRPPSSQQLAAVLGIDRHRAIAEEMGQFV